MRRPLLIAGAALLVALLSVIGMLAENPDVTPSFAAFGVAGFRRFCRLCLKVLVE